MCSAVTGYPAAMDAHKRDPPVSLSKPGASAKKIPDSEPEPGIYGEFRYRKKATPGFEPGMSDLQSDALAAWPRRQLKSQNTFFEQRREICRFGQHLTISAIPTVV